MAYTRAEYAHSAPQSKIRIFEAGEPNLTYNYEVALAAEDGSEIDSGALESIRIHINRNLTVKLPKSKFYFKIPVYPHQIVRGRNWLGFAGADRISKGMKLSFGKPKRRAAIVRKGQTIVFIRVMTMEDVNVAREILKGATKKIRINGQISTRKLA
jgi:large subunit ribosomal protein L10e